MKGSATESYRDKLSALVDYTHRNNLPRGLGNQMRNVSTHTYTLLQPFPTSSFPFRFRFVECVMFYLQVYMYSLMMEHNTHMICTIMNMGRVCITISSYIYVYHTHNTHIMYHQKLLSFCISIITHSFIYINIHLCI